MNQNTKKNSSNGQMTDRCNIELSDDMARCYINRYTDIQELFGFNLKKAKKHWKNKGCVENRSFACKGKSEVVNETSETSQEENRITYVGPNGSKLYVYEGENGKVIEGPNGTRYVISETQTASTIDEVLEEEELEENELNITKYTDENGKEILSIERPDGSTIIVTPNGEIAYVDTSYQNNPVRMYGHDKYILKTQVVPPVCPGCPGLEPSVYDNENIENAIENRQNIAKKVVSNREKIARSALEQHQQISQNPLENTEERVQRRQQMAQNTLDENNGVVQSTMQNTHSSREQEGSLNNANNMQYRPEFGELLGNNIDNYEPQSMLTDFSKFM